MEDFKRLIPDLIDRYRIVGIDSRGHGRSTELLVVRGNNDYLLSIESIAELLKLVKNAAFLNIPFAGHMAFEEQKEIFMLTINKFLNDR